jgi:predicted nucleic acid-binding protein
MNIKGRKTITQQLVRRIIEEKRKAEPFIMFSWQEWEEMYFQMQRCFPRFQRAIQQQKIDQALLVILEMDEIMKVLLEEVYAQSHDTHTQP